MNRILFEKQVDRIEMDSRDPRFEHVRGVLRMREGDTFDVGVVDGPVGKARIDDLTADLMAVSIEWGETPPLPPPINLIIGMCRPATARKILTTAPTLGVRKLIFASGDRSDPAYRRSSLWNKGEWRAHLIEGVEQAFDTHLPVLGLPDSLEGCFSMIPDEGPRLALDVYEGSSPLSSFPISRDEPATLAIGPERGWSGKDRRLFKEAGFHLVSLSDRVMRVETAVIVGLTLVLKEMNRL